MCNCDGIRMDNGRHDANNRRQMEYGRNAYAAILLLDRSEAKCERTRMAALKNARVAVFGLMTNSHINLVYTCL